MNSKLKEDEKKVKYNNIDSKHLNTLSKNKYILLITALSYFLSGYVVSVISIALPNMARDFAVSAVAQNWIAIIFFLTIAIFSIPFGKISAKFGLKKTFYLGLILLIIGSLGVSVSNSSNFLIAFRALQGFSVAILNVSTLAIVTESMPPHERGKGIGIITSIAYVGLIVANILGGFLTHNFGWRSVFLFVIPFLILTILITYFKVSDEWIFSKGEKFDYIGALIFGLAISFLTYGFTTIHELNGIILVLLAIISFAIFGKWQLKSKFPLFPIKIIKNRVFTFASFAAFLCSFATFVITYIVDYHLQYIKGIDPQLTGLILMLAPLSMAISTFFAGRLSDKFNPRILASSGLTLAFISLIILAFMDSTTTIPVIIMAIILEGVGYGMFISPNTNIVMSSLPDKFASIASATVSTTRVIGETLSLGMLTVTFAIIMGSLQILPQYFHLLIVSSKIVAIIASIGCLAGIFVSLIGVKINFIEKISILGLKK
ncbi:MFS transporter [Methanobrevibacter sp. TMH8]|uniref:MFS transporter n=1 Tax=Methanobrevibacter sp. TMH8 TaxID=2848611 RepID=UPI001CCB921E|nr:MFS transporter [Methanobrevibacter sp. TMH8]MBZ9571015.1 MFS transporter [Methanobrevibacter sp. TMH8]